jgi:hypothetical protein
MHEPWGAVACFCILACASVAGAEELNVRGPLHVLSEQELKTVLPPDTHLLLEPAFIEQWLDLLDGDPPDWPAIYGHGHHDPGHDDRLFALNRERDAKRAGKPALSWLVTFAWVGELSAFNPEAGGFSVALGPKFISTRWGVVRFKADEMPGNLVVVADPVRQAALQQEIDRQRHIDIDVVMTGRLIPDESLVYDFSHEEEGLGLIMPVVQVEQVRYVRRVKS